MHYLMRGPDMERDEAERAANEQRIRDAMGRLESREPATPLGEAAVGVHELFKSFVRSGFTERQALYILGVMISAAPETLGEP